MHGLSKSSDCPLTFSDLFLAPLKCLFFVLHHYNCSQRCVLWKKTHFNQIQFPTKSNFSSRYFRPGSSRGRSRNKFLLAVKKIIHWKCRLDKWPFITDGLAGTWKFIYMHSFDTYSNLSISFPLNVFPVDVFIIITNLSDQSDFFFFIRFGFPEKKKLFCGISSKINNNSNLKTQQN